METQNAASARTYNRAGLICESKSRNQEKKIHLVIPQNNPVRQNWVPESLPPLTLQKLKLENKQTIWLFSCKISKQLSEVSSVALYLVRAFVDYSVLEKTLEKQRKRRSSWSLERKISSVLETQQGNILRMHWMNSLRLRILKLFSHTISLIYFYAKASILHSTVLTYQYTDENLLIIEPTTCLCELSSSQQSTWMLW